MPTPHASSLAMQRPRGSGLAAGASSSPPARATGPVVTGDRIRPARSPLVLLGAFGAVAAANGWLAAQTGLSFFRPLLALNGWAGCVAGAHLLPRLRWRLDQALVAIATAACAAGAASPWLLRANRFAGASEAALELAAVVTAILAFVLYFVSQYGRRVRIASAAAGLDTLLPLVRLLAAAEAAALLAFLLRLQAGRSVFPALELAFALATAVLIGEALGRGLLRFYQPQRARAPAAEFGESVLLPAVLGDVGPVRRLVIAFERTFGLTLAETWLVQLTRAAAAPLLLLGMLGGWASTSVTRIPVDARGVLMIQGRFQPEALAPGLHVHLPWPWARVEVVTTERVREVSLGFERDLSGPVLWAEKHFEGEQNLLVGNGEELLTVNVPIHYRVRDAVAFQRRAADADRAIEALGSRELLALTSRHTAFGLMTTDRAEVAANLQAALQEAVDRLQLGLEIAFVGLKDVHPPVAVAPAYQEVVSAEEQRAALVDLARSYVVETEHAARAAAHAVRTQAESAAAQRRSRARAEAARFSASLPTWRDHPQVFAARLRFDAMESALGAARQLLVVPPEAGASNRYFFGPPASSVSSGAFLR